MSATILEFPLMARPAETMPNRIRQRRQDLRMTLQDVVDQLGDSTTPSMLSKLERGERPLTLDWLRRLARVLDTDPASLLADRDNPWSLDSRERAVIAAMRDRNDRVGSAIHVVAEQLSRFDPGPVDGLDSPHELPRKRA